MRTLVVPPRVPPGCVARADLVAKLNDALGASVTRVEAGAGYGKTTLLAQGIEASDRDWVWLSCHERLQPADVFLAHLVASFENVFSGLGRAVAGESDLVGALANEIVASVPDDFVVALDDVHRLGDGEALAVVDDLIGAFPGNVHFLLASRRELELPASRLHPGGSALISDRDLAFGLIETEQLLADVDPEHEIDYQELHRRTEGWVAALLLAARARGASVDDMVNTREQLAYLADEVMAGLPERLARFLIDTSILEQFTPELAAGVTGEDARPVIEELHSRRLFIHRHHDGEREWHRYHQLLRAYLLRRADAEDEQKRHARHRAAADSWCGIGHLAEAANHYLLCEDPAAAAAVLEPVAQEMASGVAAGDLRDLLGRIPADIRRRHPGLVLAGAMQAYLAGRYRAAFTEWGDAIEVLIANEQFAEASEALYRLQKAMLTSGAAPSLRVGAGQRFLRDLQNAGAPLARVKLLLAVAHGHACRHGETQRLIGDAAVEALPEEREVVLAFADVVRGFYLDYASGRIPVGLRAITSGVSALEAVESEESIMLQALARGYRAMMLADTGQFDESLAEAETMLRLCEGIGMRAVAEMVVMWWRLICHTSRGAWDEVAAIVDGGVAGETALRSSFSYRLLTPRARLRAVRGEAEGALADVDAARSSLEGHGDAFDKPMVLSDLASAALAAGDSRRAVALADEAHASAERLALPWQRARAALIGAAVHGPGGEGDALLAEALHLTGSLGVRRLWSRREALNAPPLLARAIIDDLGPEGLAAELAVSCGPDIFARVVELLSDADPEARRRLAEAAAEASTADIDLDSLTILNEDDAEEVSAAAALAIDALADRPRPPLRFEVMGGLRVLRGSRPIAESAFRRAKARSVLAELLCADQRGVSRDRLMEDLWPELPPERAGRALDTTVHDLRRALDPYKRAGEHDGSVVIRAGDMYRLHFGESDSCDLHELLQLAESDDAPLERLRDVEEMVNAVFLPEFADCEWARYAADRAEQARLAVLEQLAERLVERGLTGAAVNRYRQILEAEPLREGIHRALMRLYRDIGERPLAIRQYHTCRTLLRRELDIGPSEPTTRLYAEILGAQLPKRPVAVAPTPSAGRL